VRRAVAAALDRGALAATSEWRRTPTNHLLPAAVRGGGMPRAAARDLAQARLLAGATHAAVRMAVPLGEPGDHLAAIVQADLRPLGIVVEPVHVADVAAAARDARLDIRLAPLTTTLDYPDPASFLARLLRVDVPPSWLPESTRTAVARLDRLRGRARDRAAISLAARLERRDDPVVPYGTQVVGTLAGRNLGCRLWNGVDPGLDLATLCLRRN
jgi:hypothetical protein